jgi:hypothetical protein
MSKLDDLLRQYNPVSSDNWIQAEKLDIKDVIIAAYDEDYITFKKNLDAL